jgi:hypothetical protein
MRPGERPGGTARYVARAEKSGPEKSGPEKSGPEKSGRVVPV